MAKGAPKGHPLWGNPLNPKKYEPQELWDKCIEYFNWVDENPWFKNEQVKQKPIIPKDSGLKSEEIKEIINPIVKVPTQRPYSIEALCNYLDISRETFDNYSNCKPKKGTSEETAKTFIYICARVKSIIDSQHFEGGMTGAFDSGIAARKLGLIDKKDITTNGKELKQSFKIGGQIIEF